MALSGAAGVFQLHLELQRCYPANQAPQELVRKAVLLTHQVHLTLQILLCHLPDLMPALPALPHGSRCRGCYPLLMLQTGYIVMRPVAVYAPA